MAKKGGGGVFSYLPSMSKSVTLRQFETKNHAVKQVKLLNAK